MKRKFGKFGFEFLSIFIAVVSAFALNNWNDNRKDAHTSSKILTEIKNGLEKDIQDIEVNKKGHLEGIKACKYIRKLINGESVSIDSFGQYLFTMSRDYISIQNSAGYETLKSKGLDLLDNDSLRFSIISLYEYNYTILRKFEENYSEMQFHQSYSEDFVELLSPNFNFNKSGYIENIEVPLNLSQKDKNRLLTYLFEIQNNRRFILMFYEEIEQKLESVLKHTTSVLNE